MKSDPVLAALALAALLATLLRGEAAPANPAPPATSGMAANPVLLGILEETTAWASLPDTTPKPTGPARFGFAAQPPRDPVRDRVRHALPGLWTAAGQLGRADAFAATESDDFRRQDAQLGVARALFEAGRDDEAVKRVGAASAEPFDQRAQTLFTVAVTRLKSGDNAGAGKLLEQAIAWHDTNQVLQPAGFLHGFAQVHAELGHTNEAVALLDRSVAWVRAHPSPEDSPALSFLLRDVAGQQARLGRREQALETAAMITGGEQRLTARMYVVREQVRTGDVDGAVRTARTVLEADGPRLANLPGMVLLPPLEAAAALARAGRPDDAVDFLEKCIATQRAQPMEDAARQEFAGTADRLRAALATSVLVGEGDRAPRGPTDPRRLELASRIAEKSGSDMARKAVAAAQGDHRIQEGIRAGAPDPATLDVSTPAGVDAAHRMAGSLIELGREREAVAIASRLEPGRARAIRESAARMALARTNLPLARELVTALVATAPGPVNQQDPVAQLAFSLARSLAASGRTNDALAVLAPALQRVGAGRPTTPSNGFLVFQGTVLQAELGQVREALEGLKAGGPELANLGAAQVGRRLARQSGPEAAVATARAIDQAPLRNLVLVGIAQELVHPGRSDFEWGL